MRFGAPNKISFLSGGSRVSDGLVVRDFEALTGCKRDEDEGFPLSSGRCCDMKNAARKSVRFWFGYSWRKHIESQNNSIYSEFLQVKEELFGEYHDSS